VRRNFLLLLSLASSLAAAQVEAQSQGPDLRDMMSSRNIAMGGAYEALGYGAETIGGNPAALSLYKRYQIEATGSWDIPQGYGFGSLGIADSTNPLAAGVSYHFATFGGAKRSYAHITTLALAYALGELIHLGFTTRSYVLVGDSNLNAISINAGVIAKPVSFMTLGFSGHNLIGVYNTNVSRYFVASIGFQIAGQLTPAFDLRMDFNQVNPRLAYHGGIEWLIAETFPIRIGYQYDGIANHQYLSGGIGWFSSGSGIDFAYRHELGGTEGRMISLTLKLQL
jgi:hypothetical protein